MRTNIFLRNFNCLVILMIVWLASSTSILVAQNERGRHTSIGDHFDFDKPSNNFIEALKGYASWGYFDYRMKEGGYNNGL